MDPRHHRTLRNIALGFAGVIVVLVIAVSLMDWDMLRGPIARMASAKSGREVTINGHLQVHLWSSLPSISIGGLRVANPAWEAPRPLLDVQQLQVQVELSQLLRGHLVLHRIAIEQPDLYLHQEASGRANWTDTNTAPTSATAPNSKPASLPVVTVEELASPSI